MEPNAELIDLAGLVVDPDLQPRVDGLDEAHVRTLQDVPESWPPLTVACRNGDYVLVDGFHRVAAAQNLGLDTIAAQVVDAPSDGDLRGLAFALNAAHGRPLTLTDRRAEAERLLRQHPEVSNMEIARRAGLAPTTVATLREQLEAAAEIAPVEQRIGRGGYTYTPIRPLGTLPEPGVGEFMETTVGRLFTPKERVQQRKIASYLERLAVGLEDRHQLAWGTAEDAAEACRLVLGQQRAATLGERLGAASQAVLDVAISLGYREEVSE